MSGYRIARRPEPRPEPRRVSRRCQHCNAFCHPPWVRRPKGAVFHPGCYLIALKLQGATHGRQDVPASPGRILAVAPARLEIPDRDPPEHGGSRE